MCDIVDAYCTMIEADGQTACRACIETQAIRKHYGLGGLDHIGADAEEYICLLIEADEDGEDFPSYNSWLSSQKEPGYSGDTNEGGNE